MQSVIRKSHFKKSYKICSLLTAIFFLTNVIFPPSYARAQASPIGGQVAPTILNLPVPGTMLDISGAFVPPLMKGIQVDPQNPLSFNFIVDTGIVGLPDQEIKDQSLKLIKYFLASLTVPEEELWVNLSPYEGDRIIPTSFGATEMGRDLLAQDYMLKQLTASLMYPEKELGKEFWSRVYERAQKEYGTTNIPMNTFNKIWIVPERASVIENEKGAFIVDSHLKVMLEEDYVALQNNMGVEKYGLDHATSGDAKAVSGVTSDVVRNILLPEIEKEVNQGKTFNQLRQIYSSMILASWYKVKLKDSLLGKIYVDQDKTKGIDHGDSQINQKIYDQYLAAFNKGVYDYIKEDYDPVSQEIIPRKYFSGGFQANKAILNDEAWIKKTARVIKGVFAGTVLVTTMLGSAPAQEVVEKNVNPSGTLVNVDSVFGGVKGDSLAINAVQYTDTTRQDTVKREVDVLPQEVINLAKFYELSDMAFSYRASLYKSNLFEILISAEEASAVMGLINDAEKAYEDLHVDSNQSKYKDEYELHVGLNNLKNETQKILDSESSGKVVPLTSFTESDREAESLFSLFSSAQGYKKVMKQMKKEGNEAQMQINKGAMKTAMRSFVERADQLLRYKIYDQKEGWELSGDKIKRLKRIKLMTEEYLKTADKANLAFLGDNLGESLLPKSTLKNVAGANENANRFKVPTVPFENVSDWGQYLVDLTGSVKPTSPKAFSAGKLNSLYSQYGVPAKDLNNKYAEAQSLIEQGKEQDGTVEYLNTLSKEQKKIDELTAELPNFQSDFEAVSPGSFDKFKAMVQDHQEYLEATRNSLATRKVLNDVSNAFRSPDPLIASSSILDDYFKSIKVRIKPQSEGDVISFMDDLENKVYPNGVTGDETVHNLFSSMKRDYLLPLLNVEGKFTKSEEFIKDNQIEKGTAEFDEAVNAQLDILKKLENDLPKFEPLFASPNLGKKSFEDFKDIVRANRGMVENSINDKSTIGNKKFLKEIMLLVLFSVVGAFVWQKIEQVNRPRSMIIATEKGATVDKDGHVIVTNAGDVPLINYGAEGSSDKAGINNKNEVGGINLNPAMLNMQIKRDGNGFMLPLDQQPLMNMDVDGFLPVILQITPVTNLPLLLGVNLPDGKDAPSSDVPTLGYMDKNKSEVRS